jgi:putative membrane protein
MAARAALGDNLITGVFYTEQNAGVVISASCAQLAHVARNGVDAYGVYGRSAFDNREAGLAGMWRPLAGLIAVLVVLPAALAATPPDPAKRAPQAVATDAFVRQVTGAIKFELTSSHLALKKTTSNPVLGFAHQIILDYTAANMKFRQAMAEARLPLPRDAYDPAHKALSDDLAKTAPGRAFARAYLEAQARALYDDLDLYKAYAQGGDNERLKHFAQEMVPIVRGHLEQVEKLMRR